VSESQEPVVTPESGEGTPVVESPPAAPPVVDTGKADFVPKERFDGLMSSFGKLQTENKKQAEQLTDVLGRLDSLSGRKEESPAPELPQVLELVERTNKETGAVYAMFKQQSISQLLEKYPNADPAHIEGYTPEEWESSARREHERVEAAISEKEKQVREQVDAEYRARYGIPLGLGAVPLTPESMAEQRADALSKAKESGDTAEAARLLLLDVIE
jgi:hypothetical protein